MDTSSAQSPYFLCYQAAQVKLGDKGFLSRDIAVSDLLANRGDVHHIFPKKYLSSKGLSKGKYNQIANFALTQSEINIAIEATSPDVYFSELLEQCNGGRKKYGGIVDLDLLKKNLEENCIPHFLLEDRPTDYEAFLNERRKLMSLKIKAWFEVL